MKFIVPLFALSMLTACGDKEDDTSADTGSVVEGSGRE